ncbi:MAG: tetratricopeptide repeat protein, partial [Janthinobacterium lividum]
MVDPVRRGAALMATSWKARRTTMAWRRRVVGTTLATAFAAGGVPVAFGQSTDAAKLLIDQGNYWQANRRGDLAAQAWRKLLQLHPNQAEGLYGMGLVEADRGHADLAQGYLDTLRKTAPGSALIGTLASRLGQGAPPAPPSPQEMQLREARQLAQAGQPAQATQHYREALDGKTAVATPQVTLEYLQTLGGTAEGWDEARRGLEKLAHDHPGDARASLALAQHLTYREATRREGVRQLALLSTRADVGAAARASWRQGLIWLGARASDAAAYQAYLKEVPDDAAVKARFDAIVQQERAQEQAARANSAAAAGNAAANARGRAVAAGFAALQKGDLDTATARFTDVLADHPSDTDALGGMGVLRLKQEKFADAQQLLERASRGPNPGRWRAALSSATYWTLVGSASIARQAGDTGRARDLLERAIRLDPNDVTAQNALGDVLLAARDPQGAEAAYRMALRRQADNPDAIRGVVGALSQQGRAAEALQFAGRLSEQERQRIGGLGALRAQQQQAGARTAEQRGDLATARTDLENALLNDPQSPWIRLDLARVYHKLGALANARSVMDGLVASNPDLPDALYASALLYAELGDWDR